MSYSRPGKCFSNSARYFLDNQDLDLVLRLVHGCPAFRGGPARMAHAWIEIELDSGVYVVDPTAGVTMTRREYYQLGDIQPDDCRRYDVDEARGKLLEHEHYGPWYELPEGTRFRNKNAEAQMEPRL